MSDFFDIMLGAMIGFWFGVICCVFINSVEEHGREQGYSEACHQVGGITDLKSQPITCKGIE